MLYWAACLLGCSLMLPSARCCSLMPGGLTMGAVLNLRPDLFNGAILGVPFVDCLTTMLDETIPLTGNPLHGCSPGFR